MMVKTMNKEIHGTLELKLWFWWCNGGERERGGVPMKGGGHAWLCMAMREGEE